MRMIFCLDTARLRDFDNYQKTIAGLANDDLTPGARPEILKRLAGCVLCSARETGADRLIYAILQEGPDAGGIVLCGVGDGHDYETILRRLHVRQTSKTYVEYPGANVAEGATEEAGLVDEPGYHRINPYHKHFITLDAHQEEALSVSLPAIIYGPPGSGKTLVVAQMLFERALAFGKQGEVPPPRILYLAPPGELATTAQRHYEEACQAYIDAGGELPEAGLAPVTFENYADFFKNHTVEGQAVPEGKATGFLDFQAWYKSNLMYLKKKNAPSAEDCWAAFGICSLYSDVNDYKALGQDQCVIPQDSRQDVYAIFSAYKESCDKERIHSDWITPFSCEEQFGFVVLDESQTRSGSAIKSYFALVDEQNIVYIVGGHQANINEHTSSYGRGADCATLLKVALHSEKISFSTVNLPRTYRNPETVVDLLNHIIQQKKLSGLHSLVKGTDGLLEGNNGYAGDASFIYDTAQDQIEHLKEQFAHCADVCVITSPDRVERVRQMWPGIAVLTPFQAMGLEFKHVICVDLLRGDENTLNKVCKILRAPFGIDSRAAIPLEPWFNGLITSISRAIEGVHVIEAKSHQLDDIFETFKKVCGKNSAEETHPEKPKPLASSPEQWLELATRFLNLSVPDEALRLMNANVLDKTCPSYLVYMERHEAFLNESAAKSKPAMKLSPAASKKKKIKTPAVTIEAKQPEIQVKLAEPVLVNGPPVEESKVSSAEDDEANPESGKKKKKKKKKANEKKSCLVTLQPSRQQHFRVQEFGLNFSEKGLQDIFDDEQALLLLLRIPVLQFEQFGNLVEFILSKPKWSVRFFRLFLAQSSQFIANFFNATDGYGRSGLNVLLVSLAVITRSLSDAYNIFEKYPELYQLISHKNWYLKGESDARSWYYTLSPLQLFVCFPQKGGVDFLSYLMRNNSALFGANFVDLLTTKIKAESIANGVIARAELLPLFEFVNALHSTTANDFLMALVTKNKNIINNAFVKALCEPAETLFGGADSVFQVLCRKSEQSDRGIYDLRFINHLLNNSLNNPKLEESRQLVIKTLCLDSPREHTALCLLANGLTDNVQDPTLKIFIKQNIKSFDPELLGRALSSFVLSKLDDPSSQKINVLALLCRSELGIEILYIMLTKLPDIAFYLTQDALGLMSPESSHRSTYDVSDLKYSLYIQLSGQTQGFEILDLIFTANPRLLQAQPLCELFLMPNCVSNGYRHTSLLQLHCERAGGIKILHRFLNANSEWSKGLDVKVLLEESEQHVHMYNEDDLPESIQNPLHGLCTTKDGIAVLSAMLNQNENLAIDIWASLSKIDKFIFPLSLLRQYESGIDLLMRYFPEVLKPTKITQEALQKFGMYSSNTTTEVHPVSLSEAKHMCSTEPR